MKITSIFSLIGLAILIFFAACSKKDITSTEESLAQTIFNNAVTPDLSNCKIRRIYQDYMGIRVSALFTYNSAGNPFTLIYSNGGTSVDDYYFYYDSKKRLKELQLRWGPGYVEAYHYYRYNSNDQIIIDSAIFGGASGQYGYITVSSIEYDAAGRIIKETIVNTLNEFGPLAATRRPTYTYDARGNLGVLNWKSSTYDYKINPLRQNKVFQFVNRNYSMNNAAVQPLYNSKGLPLSISPSNDLFFNNLITEQIIYDCQ